MMVNSPLDGAGTNSGLGVVDGDQSSYYYIGDWDDGVIYGDTDNRGLRITFDDAIRFRTESLTLDSDPWGTALLRPDQVLMELKAPGAIPLWMVHLLTELGLYKTAFSKYGTAYQILLEQVCKGGKRYA